MDALLAAASAALADSSLRVTVVDALRSVPGLPPIVQTVHIIAIAVLVSALVVPQLRVLGVAASGQSYPEMVVRLRPWAWTALCALLISGAVFVVARPERYFFNPIAGAKLLLLVAALGLTFFAQRVAASRSGRFRLPEKLLAVGAVGCWCGVILAGRWIAYVDYLFWEG